MRAFAIPPRQVKQEGDVGHAGVFRNGKIGDFDILCTAMALGKPLPKPPLGGIRVRQFRGGTLLLHFVHIINPLLRLPSAFFAFIHSVLLVLQSKGECYHGTTQGAFRSVIGALVTPNSEVLMTRPVLARAC